MSLIERALTFVITAGPKSESNPNPVTFGPNRSNTMTLAGYRASALVDWCGGGSAMVQAQASVYGMSKSDMNAIASVGQPPLLYAGNLNELSILAGDADAGMSLIFQGTMQSAVINTSGMPSISFDMVAYGGYNALMAPVPPSSFGGAISVASIMQNFATQGGYLFENGGVNTVLSNPYFPGTLLTQIKACARAAGINFVLDPTRGPNGTLAIWPKFGFRKGGVPLISPQTGLIGYPRYTSYGIDIDVLFRPDISFGAQVQVQSSLAPACGIWNVYQVVHSLESITKNGDWMTTLQCWSPQNFAGLS